MNKYQELLQVLEKEHQITCKAADIEETDRAKAYFQLLKDFMDKETPKKPIDIEFWPCGDMMLCCPTCKHGVVAWTSFQRIDEEHKEKTAEQMFKDLDYKKRIEDGCIKFERHTENVDEALIEFDLDTKTVCASWFMEQKEITIAELRAINKQCEELNWL